MMILGTSGFNKKLAAIDTEIKDRYLDTFGDKAKIHWQRVIEEDNSALVKERELAVRTLKNSEERIETLKAFRSDIATHWEGKEDRVSGELVWAPPTVCSTDPGKYTLDLAVIKVEPGERYPRLDFNKYVYPYLTDPQIPEYRGITLKDQAPPPMLDTTSESCLIVFKNGAKTDTTIGKANNVSSYTRTYLAGQYVESREWPVSVMPIDYRRYLGGFSTKGDSGSLTPIIASLVCIITGASGGIDIIDRTDATYVTPISFIMQVLHETERFEHAHLDPVLDGNAD